MDSNPPSRGALEKNVRLFILFRLFYSSRFYYPVFTVLFLDYGLSLEQFAILNIVWSLTIVLAEVPSGALADIVGRKRLVVFASALMVVEMAVLVFVPIGESLYLFPVFLINRICSGLSEAAASGADEALAYDSLQALNRESQWSHVLEKTARYVSIGFFITMIIGALVYDEALVNGILGGINPNWSLPAEVIIKLPMILTLGSAITVLGLTLGLTEFAPDNNGSSVSSDQGKITRQLTGPFRQIIQAGRWTLNHRFVLFVILAALVLDSVARQFVVLASEYYRVIEISPAWFGIIGAIMALLGILSARVSRYLVTRRTPFFNFVVLSCTLLLGLLGISLVIPWFGVLFAVAAFVMMGMVSYQSSYYLNREVDSANRATVLSFRGLALNLGLGVASLFYTILIAVVRRNLSGELSGEELDSAVFAESLWAFPVYFLLLVVILLVAGSIWVNSKERFFTVLASSARSTN